MVAKKILAKIRLGDHKLKTETGGHHKPSLPPEKKEHVLHVRIMVKMKFITLENVHCMQHITGKI